MQMIPGRSTRCRCTRRSDVDVDVTLRVPRTIQQRIRQQFMRRIIPLPVGQCEGFLQFGDPAVELGVGGEDQSGFSIRFDRHVWGISIGPQEGSGRSGAGSYLRPFPPIIAPLGQICSTPRLRQELHGHVLRRTFRVDLVNNQTEWTEGRGTAGEEGVGLTGRISISAFDLRKSRKSLISFPLVSPG